MNKLVYPSELYYSWLWFSLLRTDRKSLGNKQVHKKMELLLQFLTFNTSGRKEFSFCFECSHKFSSKKRKEIVEVATSTFEATHFKLSKYVEDGAQSALKFLKQVQVLDPVKLLDWDQRFGSNYSITSMESVSKQEWRLYVDHIGPQSVKNLKDQDELTSSQRKFLHIFHSLGEIICNR